MLLANKEGIQLDTRNINKLLRTEKKKEASCTKQLPEDSKPQDVLYDQF